MAGATWQDRPVCPNDGSRLEVSEEVAAGEAPPGSLSWFPGEVLVRVCCRHPGCRYSASYWRDWDPVAQRPVRPRT